MILLATERDEHGRTATKPTKELIGMLEMQNVSHIVKHLHIFVRNKRGCAVRFPTGFCSAIRNANFLEDFTDQPGALSISVSDRSTSAEPRTIQRATTPRPSRKCNSN